MRQIMLDTETTGLEPAQGHRIVEIAGVEIVNRRRTGRQFHRYLDPQRDSDPGALEAHGLTRDFLTGKPLFADIVEELLGFLEGGQLVIHNAPFDVGFLDRELDLQHRGPLSQYCPDVLDTLRLARDLHPGKRNSLDALCDRYGVDNSKRTFHGALLDAELLADVYLAMTRGQETLLMEAEIQASRRPQPGMAGLPQRSPLRVVRADAQEVAAHEAQLEKIDKASKGACLWMAMTPRP